MLRVIIFVLFWSISNASAQNTITLNTANEPPNSTNDNKGIGDRVLTEAFRRLGITLKIVHLPSERALLNANEGIDDGNFARVEGMEKIYPNLIRVPEAITTFEFTAFSRRVNIKTNNWTDLRPYNIGIVTGWKILEMNITGTRSLTSVNNARMLFELLFSDRVDIVVNDKRQGEWILREMKADGVHVLRPPLAVKSMYLYLHKKHIDLVPRIEKAIKEMKADGTYHKIVNDILKDLGAKKKPGRP